LRVGAVAAGAATGESRARATIAGRTSRSANSRPRGSSTQATRSASVICDAAVATSATRHQSRRAARRRRRGEPPGSTATVTAPNVTRPGASSEITTPSTGTASSSSARSPAPTARVTTNLPRTRRISTTAPSNSICTSPMPLGQRCAWGVLTGDTARARVS